MAAYRGKPAIDFPPALNQHAHGLVVDGFVRGVAERPGGCLLAAAQKIGLGFRHREHLGLERRGGVGIIAKRL
jgi:hypothetical protein